MPDPSAAQLPDNRAVTLAVCSEIGEFIAYHAPPSVAPTHGIVSAELHRLCTNIQRAAESNAAWIAQNDVLASADARKAVLYRVGYWLALMPMTQLEDRNVLGLTLVVWITALAPGGPRSILLMPALLPRLMHTVGFRMGCVTPADCMLAGARVCSLLVTLLFDADVARAAVPVAEAYLSAVDSAASGSAMAQPPPWLRAQTAATTAELAEASEEAVGAAAREGAAGRLFFDPVGAAAFAFRVLSVYPDRPATDGPSATHESTSVLASLMRQLAQLPSPVGASGRTIIALAGLNSLRTDGYTGDGVAAVAQQVRDSITAPVDAALVSRMVPTVLVQLLDAADAWPTHAGVQTHVLSTLFNVTCSDEARARLRFSGSAIARAGASAARTLEHFVRHFEPDATALNVGVTVQPALDTHYLDACVAAVGVLYSPVSSTRGIEAATAASLALPPPSGRGCIAMLGPYIRRLIEGPRPQQLQEDPGEGGGPPTWRFRVPNQFEFRALQHALQLLIAWMRSPSVARADLPAPMRDALLSVAARCGYGSRALGDVVPEGIRATFGELLNAFSHALDSETSAAFSAHAHSVMEGSTYEPADDLQIDAVGD